MKTGAPVTIAIGETEDGGFTMLREYNDIPLNISLCMLATIRSAMAYQRKDLEARDQFVRRQKGAISKMNKEEVELLEWIHASLERSGFWGRL